jgi:hypothetical protein
MAYTLPLRRGLSEKVAHAGGCRARQQVRRTEEGRLHAAHHLIARELHAQLPAHHRAGAVAADQVLAAHLHGFAGIEVHAGRGQAGVAQRLGHAQPAEDLHRPCGDVVALHVGRLAPVARLGDQHGDAALRQVHGQRQAHRPGAHDEDLCLQERLRQDLQALVRATQYVAPSGP